MSLISSIVYIIYDECYIYIYIDFRIWEGSTRLARNEDMRTDAVGVIAFYRRLLHYDCIVLVKEYRPPLKAYTIEMPTGELSCLELVLSRHMSMLCVL
jgi:hypothetical protein